MSEAYAFRADFSGQWPAEVAATVVDEVTRHESQRDAQPVRIFGVTTLAQLVAALGQATVFAAENRRHADAKECPLVLRLSGEVQTFLGGALKERHDQAVASVPGRIITDARTALDIFAARLEDRTWIGCHCGHEDLDHVDEQLVLRKVLADRALLP